MESLGISAKGVVVEEEALEDVVKKLRVVKKNANKSTSVYQMLAENIADIKDNIDNRSRPMRYLLQEKRYFCAKSSLLKATKISLMKNRL